MRVLLIDDEPIIRTLGRAILVKAGFEVEVASSGEDGLKIAKRDAFDVILLDVSMPGCDGMEVLKALRRPPFPMDLPVILLTAHSSEEDLRRHKELGATGTIGKPFSTTKLAKDVLSLIEPGASLG